MPEGIGVYFGRKHIVAAVVKGGGTIYSFAIEPIADEPMEPLDIEGGSTKKITPETTAIRDALTKMNRRARVFARVGLSAFHVVTRYFIMPALPAKEKNDAIRFEASRHTRLKLTESIFGFSESPRPQNFIAVTANAVKKRVVQSLAMNLRRASVDPSVIEPLYVPFSRVCFALQLSDFQKPEALIWFDSDLSVNLILSSEGTVFLSQEFRLSGETDQDRAKVHDEIWGCLRFLSETAGQTAPEHMFVAGFGDVDYWAGFLGQTFTSLQVQIVTLPIPNQATEFSSSAVVLAYGLALGELGFKAPISEVTLLPHDERKMKPRYFWGAMGFVVAAVSLFFVVLSFLVLNPIQSGLQKQKDSAQVVFSEYGDDAKRTFQDLKTHLSLLTERDSELSDFEKTRISLKKALVAVANSLSSSIWLETISYVGDMVKPGKMAMPGKVAPGGIAVKKPEAPKKSRKLTLEGFAYTGDSKAESEQVNKWVQGLSDNPSFKKSFSSLVLDEVTKQRVSGRSITKFTAVAEE